MKLRALVLAGVLAVAGVATMTVGASAVQCPAGSLRAEEGDGTATSYAECNLPVKEDGEKSLMERVTDILNVIVGVVGIAAVAVIIVGGIFYVTSLGDPAKTTRAKNAILYGVVGLFVAMLAFGVVNFALNAVFGEAEAGTSKTPDPDPNPGEGDN